VWRIQDGKQRAMAEAWKVRCVAVSKDGGWIAAGTVTEVVVWDAKTYQKTFSVQELHHHTINGVDFSPDSSRLVSASDNSTTTVWDIATRERVQTLHHESPVRAAKYSPQGDRIATATHESVQVYDSNDGRLLVDITVNGIPSYNTGLLWSKAYLFVISDNKVKKIDASTGSVVSEWLGPGGNQLRRIALPTQREFIAHSTSRTVSFWDTSTHTQLGQIQHPEDILSIAISPDARFIAIGGEGGKITFKCLSRIIVSVVTCGIMAYLNHLLASIIFFQSLWLVCTPLSRNLTFRSRMLFSICGRTINSRTQKNY
jgi:WD40 repeat protein